LRELFYYHFCDDGGLAAQPLGCWSFIVVEVCRIKSTFYKVSRHFLSFKRYIKRNNFHRYKSVAYMIVYIVEKYDVLYHLKKIHMSKYLASDKHMEIHAKMCSYFHEFFIIIMKFQSINCSVPFTKDGHYIMFYIFGCVKPLQ
jgi:hypothetical protein